MKKEWKYCKLKDAVKKGSSNISLNKIGKDDGEYPVYGAQGIVKTVSFYDQDREYLGIIKDGAGIGRISKHPPKSSLLATMQYLIPENGYDIDFIKYFLEGIDFSKYRTGSTIPHIYFKDYGEERFPDIPLAEQKRIVAKLDECFAAIDKAKANAEQNLKNAKELFESYLERVFGDQNNEIKKLSELTEVKDGTHESPKYCQTGIPFITQKNIRISGLSFENIRCIHQNDHDKFFKRSNVGFGDILISMIGANRGMAALVDDKRTFSIKNVGLIKQSKKINNRYLLYYLKSPLAMKYVLSKSNGGAQEFIGLTALREFPIPTMSVKEQQKLAKKLDELSVKLKKLESVNLKVISNLQELQKSVLRLAFSGELN
ncbi:MAG: Type-1 restriction enzyme EcoKI specificity protein [Ignavibacteriaceae bacterium]|nr:Type-1 restriction enzyme EcoKI specificity protein [Ignavibacteriaceae bacterium]